jgi:hypothetical protein
MERTITLVISNNIYSTDSDVEKRVGIRSQNSKVVSQDVTMVKDEPEDNFNELGTSNILVLLIHFLTCVGGCSTETTLA